MIMVYIDNPPPSATEQSPRELIAQHGTVQSIAIVADRQTGQSRGFALAAIPSVWAARGICELDRKRRREYPLLVNDAQKHAAVDPPRRYPQRAALVCRRARSYSIHFRLGPLHAEPRSLP